jgi:hypothetical protein
MGEKHRVRLAAILAAVAAVCIYSSVIDHKARAQSDDGPLYSAHEKLTLARDKNNMVTGHLEKGHIAVAYVNLWSRQTVERSNMLYTPVATITDVQPVILFSGCDLPYKFAIERGRLEVSGKCENPNWAEAPIDVVVLYSK